MLKNKKRAHNYNPLAKKPHTSHKKKAVVGILASAAVIGIAGVIARAQDQSS